MAVRTQEKPHKAADEGDVANCVHNLVEAFTNGLNIFKRLREKRRRHKVRKQNQTPEPINSAELQLSNSLRRGPQDLEERYNECYSQTNMGRRFAKGDPIAHASLAEILMRLNTGLVSIITAFLHHEEKGTHGHMKMNYKSLTDLSEASRRDALTSMNQLYQRLSQSQLQIHPALRTKTPQNHESSGNSSDSSKEARKSTASHRRPSGSHVTRMPLKSSNQPQLCMVRSKSRNAPRKESISGGSSGTSKPTSKSSSPYASPFASPLQSPVPEYAVLDPMIHNKLDFKNTMHMPGAWVDKSITPASADRKRVDSLDASRPAAWPYAQPYDYFSLTPEQIHEPKPKLPESATTSRKTPAPSSPKKAPPVPVKPVALSATTKTAAPAVAAPIKRRLDKATPSSYTFASDSTKLGEIPETRWRNPWDYERAEMLNNMAAAAAKVRVPSPAVDEKGRGREKEKEKEKKGLRFWRRVETA